MSLPILKLDNSKKRLLKNFVSLSLIQGMNYVFPLITLPYLIRILGPEKFGVIVFAQALIQYLNILTDYGFNLSATREISTQRENKEKVSEIFSAVIVIKLGLLLLSFTVLTIIIFSFEKFRKDWLIYYFTFGTVIGQTLFPIWFFQGVEEMRYIVTLNIVSKLIFVISVFIFVHNASSYVYVPLLNSLGFIITGVLALWIVFRDFNIKFKVPNLKQLTLHLRKGWHIFVSTLAGNIYGQGTVFILGLVADDKVVGYYSSSEKLIKSLASLSQPIAQALYPFLNRVSFGNLKIIFLKVMFLSSKVSFLFTCLLYMESDKLISFLYGNKMLPAMHSLHILCIGMFFVVLNVIKQPFIFAIRKDRENSFMYISVGLSFIPICAFLSKAFKDIGAAMSFLYVEASIFIIGMAILQPLWRR